MKITRTYQGQEQTQEINKSEIIIGRLNPYLRPDVDLSEDITVSRTHARIWFEDGKYWIEDSASKHGTFVNKVKLNYRRELHSGDVVQVGDTHLAITLPNVMPKTPATPSSEGDIKVDTALDAEEPTLAKVAAAHGKTHDRLALLMELPLEFATRKNLEDLLQFIVERTVRVIPGAERGAILLRNRDNGELELKAFVSPDDAPVSLTLAQRAIHEGRALIWRRIVDGVSSKSMVRLEMKTGMYAPLMWNNKSIGVLCVDNPKRDALFNEDDLRLMLAVANYAAMAVGTRRMQEGL